jgi:hypothetical protein
MSKGAIHRQSLEERIDYACMHIDSVHCFLQNYLALTTTKSQMLVWEKQVACVSVEEKRVSVHFCLENA